MSKICTTCAGLPPKQYSACSAKHPCPSCGGRGYPIIWYVWHGAGVAAWLFLAARSLLVDRSVAGVVFCGLFVAAHVWMATWKRKREDQ